MVDIIVPVENDKEIELVLNNFQESWSWLNSSGYMQEWQDWNDLYRSIPDKKPFGWMSNKFVPITNSKVEAGAAMLQSLLISANPSFQVRPRERSDTPNAEIMQKLLQYQLDEAEVPRNFIQFLRCVCKYGTGIMKVVWDRRYDYRTLLVDKFEPVQFMGLNLGQRYVGKQPQEQKYRCFDGPVMINCNLADIYPEPTSIEIQDGWVVERSYVYLSYLRAMYENHPDVYNDQVMKLTEQDGTNTKKAADDTQSSNSRLNDTAITRSKGEARIELKTRWGLAVDPTDGRLKQRVMTVAGNSKLLIRNTNNPFWHNKVPFIKSCYIPVENEFYGIGVCELGEDMQTSINETVNQRNDNITFSMNRIIVYLKNRGIDIKKLKSEPGIKIGVESEGDGIDQIIRFLEIPPLGRDSFLHVNDFERWFQEVTGVTKITLGLTGADTNETATGMSILQKASSDRFMAIGRLLEQTAFKPLLEMFYQLDYQYVTTQQMVRIVGEQGSTWLPVQPEDVRRNYDFIPAGIFTMENKAQTVMKLLQFKQITKDDPTVKQTEINKKIYQAMQIGDDPKEIMYDDAEMQNIMMIAKTMALKIVQQMTGEKVGEGQGKGSGGTHSNIPNTGQFNVGSVAGQSQVPPPPASPLPLMK